MPLLDSVVIPVVAWCYGARPDDGTRHHAVAPTPTETPAPLPRRPAKASPEEGARAALHRPTPVNRDLILRAIAGLERLESVR